MSFETLYPQQPQVRSRHLLFSGDLTLVVSILFVSFLFKHFLHSSLSGVVEVQRTVSFNLSFEGAFSIVGEACALKILQFYNKALHMLV